MGRLWLNRSPAWLRAAGLDVIEFSGWQLRSRSSGGFDEVYGICAHHDVSSPTARWQDLANRAWITHADAPIGNFILTRQGQWIVGAAGATNTQGKGGPMQCSRGTIPLDQSNRFVPAVEAMNNGTGEWWPDVQLDAYELGIAALCDGLRDDGAYDSLLRAYRPIELDPLALDVHGHLEWAPTRKIDPAGPPRYNRPNDPYMRWAMNGFRSAVAARLNNPPLTPAGGPVTITPSQLTIDTHFERMYDSRPAEPPWHNPSLPKTKLGPGEERKVAAAFGHVVFVRLTVLGGAGPGFVSVAGAPGLVSPLVNLTERGGADGAWGGAQTMLVAVPDGHLYLTSPHTPVDVIVDVSMVGA